METELFTVDRAVAIALAALPIVCLAASATAAAGPADKRLAEEIRLAHQWAVTAFAKPRLLSGPVERRKPSDELTVLHKSYKVLRNRTVWNTPLRLGQREYRHGLYMDAPAAVRVRLSRPAKMFTAVVGIDDNKSTQKMPDSGSARFHVVVGNKSVLSTPVMKLRSEPVRVQVPLGGATEFFLKVDDGGDGRRHDQCSWADAAVKLDDESIQWLDQLALFELCPWQGNPSTAPFSFTYADKPSAELLPEWNSSAKMETDGDVLRRVVSYEDPKTGLLLESHVTTYANGAGVDWVFYLSNTGKEDTPIIEQFMPLDTGSLSGAALPKGSVTLRWSKGDGCTIESFLPHDEVLEPGQPRQFKAVSSDTSCFPFFNVRVPGGGWILAVGWSGRWMADFLHRPNGQLAVRVGMQTTHFRLKPGERVRTPRILLMRYLGDEMIDGHNRFRRLMLDHYIQRRDGKPAEPPVAHMSTASLHVRARRAKEPVGRLNEQGELAVIRRIVKFGCEAYWMDAYWHPQRWPTNLGNWYPRPEDFPRGLRPLSDAAHREGMKFVLWFAPFYVSPETRWAKEYPQHFYAAGKVPRAVMKIGDPAAQKFLADWLNARIEEWGIDIYREDIGIGYRSGRKGQVPGEGPERVGIAEMKHIEGFYNIWSDLLRRNPDLLIDNCNGGGRRIDLETNSRAFTLWRSDLNDVGRGIKGKEYWPIMARADQVMVTGLSLYIPFHTGPVWDMHPYNFRSAMASGIVVYNDLDDETFSDDLARQAIVELKQLRPLFQGNIYPLMPLTISQADWYAYQLDRPDLNRGCAFVFRRPEASGDTRQLELRNIDPEATYLASITGETYIEPAPREMSGRELLTLEVQIQSKPGSALLRYDRETQ